MRCLACHFHDCRCPKERSDTDSKAHYQTDEPEKVESIPTLVPPSVIGYPEDGVA